MLSDLQIDEIKEKYSSGLYTELQLSHEYKCSIMTISLWLKEDPWSVIKKKTRSNQSDFTGRARCAVCNKIIDDEKGVTTPCDCQRPKDYYRDEYDDVLEILNNERKSFFI